LDKFFSSCINRRCCFIQRQIPISLGKKVSDEKILEYIEEIGLNDWYLSLDNGLDTIITNVSDVVLRSINIIRAIVLDKNVYFFDEITLGMNLDGEKKVVAMLKKYFKDKTFIIISDRPILNNICNKHYFIKNHTLLEKESLL
jgi:ABC-type multidrug transport system fused ATPase/permease subunit